MRRGKGFTGARHVQQVFLVALVVSVALTVLTTPAGAGTYGWQGTVGPGFGNGNCALYSGQSACSGWNYWTQINTANDAGDIVFSGFETASIIRGTYLSAGQSAIVYPSESGMGGWYTKAHSTWCSWRIDCALRGGANVWFRSYA